MKISFDLDKNGEISFFRTKEEWDSDPFSYAGWLKRCKESKSGGANYRYYNEPYRFPCIMIEAGCISNPNGPDHELNAFIYDFEIEE